MATIDPSRLKLLRENKRWSQEELAEKTKSPGLPKIDKQTISRLERGKAGKTRGKTLQQLARALAVDPAVLTGEAPLPETKLTQKYQFNVRISRATRNALILVARRYSIEPWQIVELAPFLFFWAAEASLRRRHDQLTRLETALETLQDIESEIWELPFPKDDFDTQIEAERRSIDSNDIFGNIYHGNPDLWNATMEDPFSQFLQNLAKDLDDTTFVRWSEDGTPSYSVCSDAAAELVGGNRDLGEFIVRGWAALSEMPKEIWRQEMVKERVEWVIANAKAYAEEQEASLNDLKSDQEASS